MQPRREIRGGFWRRGGNRFPGIGHGYWLLDRVPPAAIAARCPTLRVERAARAVKDHFRFSAVAIKLDPLKIEFARRQPQMPPLMGLIPVQPASGLPLAFHIFSFLS